MFQKNKILVDSSRLNYENDLQDSFSLEFLHKQFGKSIIIKTRNRNWKYLFAVENLPSVSKKLLHKFENIQRIHKINKCITNITFILKNENEI